VTTQRLTLKERRCVWTSQPQEKPTSNRVNKFLTQLKPTRQHRPILPPTQQPPLPLPLKLPQPPPMTLPIMWASWSRRSRLRRRCRLMERSGRFTWTLLLRLFRKKSSRSSKWSFNRRPSSNRPSSSHKPPSSRSRQSSWLQPPSTSTTQSLLGSSTLQQLSSEDTTTLWFHPLCSRFTWAIQTSLPHSTPRLKKTEPSPTLPPCNPQHRTKQSSTKW